MAVAPEVSQPPLTREPADAPPAEPAPSTRPIHIAAPAVEIEGLDLDGLGVADRLGLASDDDEVGPTS